MVLDIKQDNLSVNSTHSCSDIQEVTWVIEASVMIDTFIFYDQCSTIPYPLSIWRHSSCCTPHQ
jgi:ligand-binding SRPBCC domain-containing protein